MLVICCFVTCGCKQAGHAWRWESTACSSPCLGAVLPPGGRRCHSGSCLPWELGWAVTSGQLPSHLGFSWRPEPRGLACGLSSLSGFACSSHAGGIRGGRNYKASRGPGREVRQHRLSCVLLVREQRMSLDSHGEETDSLPDGSSRCADGHGDSRGCWGAFVQALCCTLLLRVPAQPLSVGTRCCLGVRLLARHTGCSTCSFLWPFALHTHLRMRLTVVIPSKHMLPNGYVHNIFIKEIHRPDSSRGHDGML